jgi:AcrR family transcriptional regulator
MAASEPRSERADARLNRERIIEAARSLFLEHGTAVEMRHLAERAGVGVELVRRHIATLLRTFSTTAPLAMEMMAAPTFETMRGRVLAWLTDPRLDAAIQRGIRCGCFRADLDIPAARLFIAGAADPLVVMAACPPLTPARLEARLAELVLRALLAPGQPLPADLAPAGQKGT